MTATPVARSIQRSIPALTGNARPQRFTPMCMGKTLTVGDWRSVRPVHPHVHGEDSAAASRPRNRCGSPPCAWGRRGNKILGDATVRFTPMCMGKTHRFRDGLRLHCGSPPCAWGRRRLVFAACQYMRFTPMCMGKTLPRASRDFSDSVHPHVHGEDRGRSGCDHHLHGSPPCAWGRRGARPRIR